MILPGIVNAHSHLEYAVYAGFGDGEPFAGWLATHIARKRALDHDAMLAIARRGAADSLAAGITTTADYSFSGAAVTAAAELGLRAIVYLEVFASDPADAAAQFEATQEPRRGDRARADRRLAARARTRAASRSTAGRSRSAFPSARISPRAQTKTTGSSTAAAR